MKTFFFGLTTYVMLVTFSNILNESLVIIVNASVVTVSVVYEIPCSHTEFCYRCYFTQYFEAVNKLYPLDTLSVRYFEGQ